MDLSPFIDNLACYVSEEAFMLARQHIGTWILVFHDGKVSFISNPARICVGAIFNCYYYNDSAAEIVEIDPYNRIMWVEKLKHLSGE